jgi:hypothetical protein
MTVGETGEQALSCNIGPEETARRRRVGYFGLFLSILWIVAVELFSLGPVFRLMLIFPAGIAFSGFLQARARFCMAYGARGVASLGGLQQFSRSADPFGDKRRAARMVGQVILFSAIVAGLFWLIG